MTPREELAIPAWISDDDGFWRDAAERGLIPGLAGSLGSPRPQIEYRGSPGMEFVRPLSSVEVGAFWRATPCAAYKCGE